MLDKMLVGFCLLLSLAAALNVTIYDQGTDVLTVPGGAVVAVGNLTVLIFDAPAGGNLIYNHTFTNGIQSGTWDVAIENITLNYSQAYWKDYEINGDNINFSTDDRILFFSTWGAINSTSLIESINLSNATGYLYSNLVGTPSESDPLWSSNYSLFNDSWSMCYNVSYLTSEADPLWSANYTAHNDSWSTTYNATYDAFVSGNSSWNQSLADSLYYPLLTNPLAYWNATFATFNKTYGDTLYYPLPTNPLNYWNASSYGLALTNLTNWTATSKDTSLLINTTVDKPACTAAERGGFWMVQGGNNVADYLYICMKNSSNSYNWVQLAVG